MSEMTTEQKLYKACVDNCSPNTLLRLMKHDEAELINKLRKMKSSDGFTFVQGQLEAISRYIDVLERYIGNVS